MRWLLVALCACNQIYDLRPTIREADPFFDAPPSAPYVCPAAGQPFEFLPVLKQSQLDCKSYSESVVADRAVMLCRDGFAHQLYGGTIKTPTVALKELPQSTDSFRVEDARLSADGDVLFVETFDYNTDILTQVVYRWATDRWMYVENIANPPLAFSTMTRGPEHRTIAVSTNTDPVEYSDASGAFRPLRSHRRTELGVQTIDSVWLSSDGLRMVFFADRGSGTSPHYMAQSERATLADEFGPAIRLVLPTVDDTFITEDCGRFYFSGLRILFYAEQQQ